MERSLIQTGIARTGDEPLPWLLEYFRFPASERAAQHNTSAKFVKRGAGGPEPDFVKFTIFAPPALKYGELMGQHTG